MQEKQVDDEACAEYGWYGAEHTREESRYDKGVVLVRVGHTGGPDIARHSANEAPPDGRASPNEPCERHKEERTKSDTGYSCRNLKRIFLISET